MSAVDHIFTIVIEDSNNGSLGATLDFVKKCTHIEAVAELALISETQAQGRGYVITGELQGHFAGSNGLVVGPELLKKSLVSFRRAG